MNISADFPQCTPRHISADLNATLSFLSLKGKLAVSFNTFATLSTVICLRKSSKGREVSDLSMQKALDSRATVFNKVIIRVWNKSPGGATVLYGVKGG